MSVKPAAHVRICSRPPSKQTNSLLTEKTVFSWTIVTLPPPSRFHGPLRSSGSGESPRRRAEDGGGLCMPHLFCLSCSFFFLFLLLLLLLGKNKPSGSKRSAGLTLHTQQLSGEKLVSPILQLFVWELIKTGSLSVRVPSWSWKQFDKIILISRARALHRWLSCHGDSLSLVKF